MKLKETIKIHPAILENNLKSFFAQIKKATEYTDHVDIDIIDWNRTNNKTILVQEALSLSDDIKMNFDLMMDYPLEAVKLLLEDKRVKMVVLNFEQKESFYELIEMIKERQKLVAIALNPENKVNQIGEILTSIDHVQIYTVSPGQQGNPFLEEMLNKSIDLKKTVFKGTIGFDGGINRKTIRKVKNYPINYLSVGSELTKTDDPQKIYYDLNNLLK